MGQSDFPSSCSPRNPFRGLHLASIQGTHVVEPDGRVRMTFGHGIVDGLAIIRAVCLYRRNVGISLIKSADISETSPTSFGCAAVASISASTYRLRSIMGTFAGVNGAHSK